LTAVAGLLGSSIGKKVVMAATGLVLFGFVVGHMLGNLQLYVGPKALNDYGEFLREFLHGQGLWLARAVLLACVGLHVWAATSLTLMNRAARPVGYRARQYEESTYASRTMRVSGVVVLAFVVYHLMHFTFGNVHPSFVAHDVYHNVVAGFQVPWVSGFYVLAMLCLGLHLHHGVWSMLQTLGLSHPRYDRLRQAFAGVITLIVIGANISFPIAVLAGLVHE